ncbi:restriction endonuclease subunit S [Porphyromonas gulae]|uniref:restriction endonuclease subunit S n=1 Tax=Porphyromonas gulae TaxID=111105 RepID=UPI0009B865D7|nr:restriction endonuclease subunit S [Porphyromonas gulae]
MARRSKLLKCLPIMDTGCIPPTVNFFQYTSNYSKDNLFYTGDFKDDFLLEKGDLITPLTEQAIGLLGSTAWIPKSGKYIQSQDIAKITCKEELLNKKFAYYLISSNMVKQQLSAAAQQTKIRHTSPDKIRDCTVWIPSLSEQTQIGQLLFDIDCKMEINRSINHNLPIPDHSLREGEARLVA